MRRDFEMLLEKLNTPGNDIVEVLMTGDSSSLDELNEYKKLLEDTLTDAENILHNTQAQKKEIIVRCSLPFDHMGNLGDPTRVDRDDHEYFYNPKWLPNYASIDDNRLDRTWIRPPETIKADQSRGLVGGHGFVDVFASPMAIATRDGDDYALSSSDNDHREKRASKKQNKSSRRRSSRKKLNKGSDSDSLSLSTGTSQSGSDNSGPSMSGSDLSDFEVQDLGLANREGGPSSAFTLRPPAPLILFHPARVRGCDDRA